MGSLLFLVIAYLWSQAIIDDGRGRGLVADGSDWKMWTTLAVLIQTGWLWLLGGIGALIYGPIFLLDGLRRIIKYLWSLREP